MVMGLIGSIVYISTVCNLSEMSSPWPGYSLDGLRSLMSFRDFIYAERSLNSAVPSPVNESSKAGLLVQDKNHKNSTFHRLIT